MIDEEYKLSRRIAVHDKYALGAAIQVLHLGIFKKSDAICAKIAQYCQFNKYAKINDMQISTLKKRMSVYSSELLKKGGIPDDILNYASSHIDTLYQKHISNNINNLRACLSEKQKYPIIILSFKFDPVIIEQIKKLEAPKFDRNNNTWKIKATVHNCEQLYNMGFTFSSELDVWYKKYSYKFFKEPLADIRIRGIKYPLFPFQKQGVAYVLSRNNRALIGDEMGLGKSVQAIAWLQAIAYERPALIVCPASLKYNWAKEIQHWVNDSNIYVIHSTPNRYDTAQQVYTDKYQYRKGKNSNTYIIINYDIISNVFKKNTNKEGKVITTEIYKSRWIDFLKELNIKCIVLDEAQYIKNKETHRTVATIELSKNIPNILALSGTPIDNRPIEFFTLLNLLNPFQFSNKMEYAKRYCNAHHNGYGWDLSGSSNLKELHEVITKSVMIRRLKSEVLTDLPPKRRVIVNLDIDNRTEYNKASSNVVAWLKDKGFDEKATAAEKAIALVKINTLMQLTIKGKINHCINWIRTYLENDEKLVVFTTHTKTIDILLKEFKHIDNKGIAVVVDGSTPPKKRQEYVEIFQNNDKCTLFIGNLIAAGVGLTLTKAPNTCHLELSMVPSYHLQAEDRVHRIGQKANAVCAYYLIALNTIEEDIVQMLNNKYTILQSTLDGIEINSNDVQHTLLSDLITTLQTRK